MCSMRTKQLEKEMYTDRDYYLTCLAEEAAKLVQAATKAIRFGKDNDALDLEYTDLVAVAERLGLQVGDTTTKLEKIEYYRRQYDEKYTKHY